jgi:hypothetical protein
VQLDPESRSDIEAYKGSVTPSATTREANWEAIASRALRGDAPEWVNDADVVPKQHRGSVRWLVAGAMAVAAAAIAMLVQGGNLVGSHESAPGPASASYEVQSTPAAAGEAAVRDEPMRGPAREAASVEQSVDEPETSSDELELASPSDSAELEASSAKPEVEARPRRARPAPAIQRPAEEEREPADPLAAVRVESSLVGRARAALRDSDPVTALRLLDEHARRFPQGELEQERELLRVTALCDAGDSTAAANAAAAFRLAFPGSPLLGHLESACAER